MNVTVVDAAWKVLSVDSGRLATKHSDSFGAGSQRAVTGLGTLARVAEHAGRPAPMRGRAVQHGAAGVVPAVQFAALTPL